MGEEMSFAARLARVEERIRAVCERAGRPRESVTLLPVTKGQSPAALREALDRGLRLFAENKIQEARIKIAACPGRVGWHFIGHLQTNKIRDAVRLFEMIQSVDGLSLAQALDQRCERQAKSMPVLLEVNVSGETSKYGFSPEQLARELPALDALPRLEIHGLMTIAPWSQDPERARPCFRKLAEIRRRCETLLGVPLPQLSMGMSGDYEVAIEEGATLIRLGTALFGPRPKASIAGPRP